MQQLSLHPAPCVFLLSQPRRCSYARLACLEQLLYTAGFVYCSFPDLLGHQLLYKLPLDNLTFLSSPTAD